MSCSIASPVLIVFISFSWSQLFGISLAFLHSLRKETHSCIVVVVVVVAVVIKIFIHTLFHIVIVLLCFRSFVLFYINLFMPLKP